MIKTRLTTFALTGGVALALMCGSAQAEVKLSMDQVRVLAIKVPFKAVSVGNPLIADATVIDENHVFLIGREFGTTNLVAVDDEGNTVADELITVTTQQGAMITVQRGPAWSTLTCNAGRCDARPTPGDEIGRYRGETDAIAVREQQAISAASTAAPATQ